MPRPKKANLRNVRTISINSRKNKVTVGNFGRAYDPGNEPFSAFIASLPRFLAAGDLRRFVGAVVASHRAGRPVIAMIGAHVVKVGLSPVIIDLIDSRVITAVAMNSAAAIHDTETALWGKTSEDVEKNLRDGTFGMSRETGEFINRILARGYRRGSSGYGESIGKALSRSAYAELSILAACHRNRVPATVHAAIGTDIIHQQPSMSGAATGELSFRDFRLLCGVVGQMRRGGVVMNIGSAVVLPEVFLKALTVARNLGSRVSGFTTANFDMIQHYRPRMNVVHRPTSGGGRGYLFTGHHEIMIPLLTWAILSQI